MFRKTSVKVRSHRMLCRVGPQGMLRRFHRNITQCDARRRVTKRQWNIANRARGQICVCINFVCIKVK